MNSYFDRLDQVAAECAARLAQAKAEPLQPVELSQPVNYGAQFRKDFELLSLKGKPTKKYFHVVIDRTCAGRYELTSYIL